MSLELMDNLMLISEMAKIHENHCSKYVSCKCRVYVVGKLA